MGRPGYAAAPVPRPTLILLPGMDGTGDLFRPFMDIVPPGWPCRTVSYPTDRILRYDELLTVAERHLCGERDVVVVAESFSGPLALRLACGRPAQVKAVVLVAS